jgi:hypothetical protein
MTARSLGAANRRQFLAAGIAGSALVASFPVRAGTVLADPAHNALAGFVFDARHGHGAAMAQGFGRGATRTYAITGDVSEVWYDHLAPSLAQGRHAIGGLTSAGALFVLGRLGHDAGWRLSMHGIHRSFDDGRMQEHELDAPPFAGKLFDTALQDGLPWISALRAVLVELATRPTDEVSSLPDMSVRDSSGQVTLHSWLLTPRG